MNAGAVADALVVLHALFVVFAIGGGILVVWRPVIAFAHLPAALWAAWVELSGTICPLTPLENAWRRAAGEAGYTGGFVEHYVVPVLYPAGLTARMQVGLGIAVVAINALLYTLAWWRARRNATRELRDNGGTRGGRP
jgi:Protein of Unknown function (DUF2784)